MSIKVRHKLTVHFLLIIIQINYVIFYKDNKSLNTLPNLTDSTNFDTSPRTFNRKKSTFPVRHDLPYSKRNSNNLKRLFIQSKIP